MLSLSQKRCLRSQSASAFFPQHRFHRQPTAACLFTGCPTPAAATLMPPLHLVNACGSGALCACLRRYGTQRTLTALQSSTPWELSPAGVVNETNSPAHSRERAVDADKIEALFWSCPLQERLAAITVARFMLEGFPQGTVPPVIGVQPLSPDAIPVACPANAEETSGEGTCADDDPRVVYGAMPMKAFVDQIPPTTRDFIFQSRQDPVQYVRSTASTLLELVYQHSDGSVSFQDADAPVAAAASPITPSSPPPFGSLAFVRVRGGARAAAAICHLTEQAGQEPARVSSAASAGAAGSATDSSPHRQADGAPQRRQEIADCQEADAALSREQVEALLPILLSALRKKEERNASRYTTIKEAYLLFMREAARFPADSTLDFLAHHLTREQFLDLFLPDPSAAPPAASAKEQRDGDSAASIAELVEAALWVMDDKYLAVRKPDVDGESPPRFLNPQPRMKHAGGDNNYGGWGAADAVPTKEDVYEILKYVPVNWGNLGSLNIPVAVRKKHLRTSSPLQWFRRQPYYFEVRDMNGTTEIRRSCVLHPEAHGMSREDAVERLELAIASGRANDLTPLGPGGVPLEMEMSAVEKAIHKFFARVCPPYFAPLSLVMQRYTKKNLDEATLLAMAKRRPSEFEVFQSRYVDVPLVRKRVGADSRRWRSAFVSDLESHPEDVRGIVMIMNRLCPSWDRPEYVYVRLTAQEQRVMGGFDAMMTILKRHPEIFRIGENFVCRVDSSDPFAAQEPEPSAHDVTSRSTLREENPYLSPIDVALVFHYAAPAEEPCTAAFLVDCASPAMRVALPPRVVTIAQQFPRLFACKETAPGVYSIRKVVSRPPPPPQQRQPPAASGGGGAEGAAGIHDGATAVAGQASTTAAAREDADEDDSWMELAAEIAEEEQLTKPELLSAVLELIPKAGVEGAQLLLWASMQVQRAANHYYGGLLKMVEAEKRHFRVVDNQESKMVYRAAQDAEAPPHQPGSQSGGPQSS